VASPGDVPPAAGGRDDGIVRNTAFAFLVQITTAAFTAALTLYLVRALDPAGYGVFALAVAIGSLLLLPSDLGISSSAARFVAERRGDRAAIAGIVADALTLKGLVAGALSLALVAAAGPIADAYDEPNLVWPLRAVALAVFGQGLLLLLQGAFIAQGRVAVNLRIQVSESVVETGASIVFVALGAGATGAAFGRTAGYLVGALVALLVTGRLLGRAALTLGRLRGGRAAEIARYAGPLFVVDIAYAVSGAIDPLLVAAFLDTTAVGIFQAPARLVAFLHYIGYSVASAVAPRLARHERQAPRIDAFRAALRWLVLIYAPLAVGVGVWADPIADVLLGAGYEESGDVLLALAPYVLLSGLAPLASLTVNFLGAARRRVPVALATLAVNVGVSAALIPTVGVVGAAIGTSVAYFVYVVGHLDICRREIGLPLRPLGVTVARAVLGAGAVGAVLLVAGPAEASLAEWLLAPPLAVLAYVAVLALTRELTGEDLRAARRLASRARS
jgi:O-antigen/teichoic acid export membrane protein